MRGRPFSFQLLGRPCYHLGIGDLCAAGGEKCVLASFSFCLLWPFSQFASVRFRAAPHQPPRGPPRRSALARYLIQKG